MSILITSYRRSSIVKSATNIVTCKIMLNNKANVANKANVFTAGMLDIVPRTKQLASVKVVNNMLGPTLAIVSPILSGIVVPLFLNYKLN